MSTGVPILDLLLIGLIIGASVSVACLAVAGLGWLVWWAIPRARNVIGLVQRPGGPLR